MPLVLIDAVRSLWTLRRDAGFVALGIMLFLTVVGGGVGYWLLEDLSLFDAVYLSVTTLTTIGFGDPAPETAAGKVFTMVLALVGIGILLAFVTTLAEHMRRHSLVRARLAAHIERGEQITAASAFGDYDLLVVGSDEASRRTAIEAAAAGLRVVIIEPGRVPVALDEAA